ncbi:MAG TPA: hypothetical protein VFZ61_24710 [Polyangiales bacterium]
MLTCLAHAALDSRPATAQPPSLSFVHAAAVAAYAASIAQQQQQQSKPAPQPAKARTGTSEKPKGLPHEPKKVPPLPSVLERLGGDHAKRAMQVAQGVPAGRVALRPMFWMTRDQRGGMVALGGRF